ncbi:unnamed protein product [Mycena citricolor]|uniref:Carboxylic ester hydrolase n=1 Tax=Mycena citricolor TaxID=2018698 RepID=A0AAD2JX88_9AGAR|nr:unnamed protein product [Mycena citricolor]
MRQSSLPLLLVSFALAVASAPTSQLVDSDLTLLFQNDLDCVWSFYCGGRRETERVTTPCFRADHKRTRQLHPPHAAYTYSGFHGMRAAQREPDAYEWDLLFLRCPSAVIIRGLLPKEIDGTEVLGRRLRFLLHDDQPGGSTNDSLLPEVTRFVQELGAKQDLRANRSQQHLASERERRGLVNNRHTGPRVVSFPGHPVRESDATLDIFIPVHRLGALGFLALDDGVTNGNYGLADMITALKWVQKYISAFGGDPSRITIFGQSAGAGAVRALLGSPPAFGLFSGAIAQSNLAGFAYAKTYSEYYTIKEEVAAAASAFVSEMGCANATANATLTCLRGVSWQTLQNAPDSPRYLVVDGHYLVRDRLSVDGKGPIAPNVHVMFGWMADDGTDFAGGYPGPGESQLSSVEAIGLPANTSSAILASGQFPTYTSGNATLDVLNVTSRIATDGEFSCLDQATLHSAALHKVFESVWAYQFDRSYMGYEPIPGVCDPPGTAAHPFGDPSLPYFKCHSGELYFVFGNIGQSTPGFPFRDAFDLPFEQLALDSWASFARTHDPNPDPAFLDARSFAGTKNALAQWGSWLPVQSAKPVRILDWPSRSSAWLEQKQCAVLGFPLDYYE